jgi:outer membrane protein assembly factor BamB
MSSRCATSGKVKLLLPALLILAGLSGCVRTVTTPVASPAASSCGTVVVPTALPTMPPNIVVRGPEHVESIVTSGENAYVGSDNGSIYAFSAASCIPLWQRHLASQGAAVYAVSDGIVYASNTNEQTPVSALSAATGKVLWQFSLPGALVFRMVVLQDGVVFTDGESSDHQHTITALRASDGHVLWQDAPFPGLPLAQSELLGTGTGVVYIEQAPGGDPVYPTSSTLLALDARSGRVLWTATLATSDGEAASAPVETSGVLCVQTSRGAVYGLQPSTGIQLWHIAGPGIRVPTGGPYGIVAPAVANGQVYATGVDGVTAYQATDGRVAWHYQSFYNGPFPLVPVLVSGVIYVSTGDLPSDGVIALQASDGTVLWKRQGADTPDFGPMLVDAGLLISNGNLGPVYALKMNDGSQVWRSPYKPEGVWYGSFGAPEALGSDAHGSGVLYVGSGDGVVHALRATDGRQLWQYAIS